MLGIVVIVLMTIAAILVPLLSPLYIRSDGFCKCPPVAQRGPSLRHG